MDRGLIDAFEIQFKFALRNLKSAILLSAMLNALCFSASAQQPAKIPRIAYLSGSALSPISDRDQCIPARSARAWLHGGEKHCHRVAGADGNRESPAALAAELVRLKVDVIVTSSGGDTRAAKEATTTIPIVMARLTILLKADSSPAWRGQAGTSPDCL